MAQHRHCVSLLMLLMATVVPLGGRTVDGVDYDDVINAWGLPDAVAPAGKLFVYPLRRLNDDVIQPDVAIDRLEETTTDDNVIGHGGVKVYQVSQKELDVY